MHQAKSLKGKMDSHRKFTEKVADFLTRIFGSITFLALNALWFLVWILINMGFIPGIPVFDPFPFGLLTMIVSLEAICLAVIVLISQNRAAYVQDLRAELDLLINEKSENEITRLLTMVDEIHDHLGLEVIDDAELKKMKRRTNYSQIVVDLEKEFLS